MSAGTEPDESGHYEPTVKILDLGLALLQGPHAAETDELTGAGQMMGTLDYMAPEQGMDSHDVDIRTDVYSLGATLHKLLTGHAPFSGQKYTTPAKKLMALATEEVPSIKSLLPDLPDELAALVHRMLAKSPDERFTTPGEVAAALEPFSAGCDLPGLLAEAQGQAESPIQADKSPAATDEYLSSAEVGTTPSREPRPAPAPRPLSLLERARRHPRIVAIAVGLLPLLFALGIVIWIDRTRIEVPEGSDIRIADDGSVRITTPGVQGAVGKQSPPLAIAPFDTAQAKKHQQAWADYLGLPVEWTNSIGMKFVLVPPGEFTMGSTEEEWERFQPAPG